MSSDTLHQNQKNRRENQCRVDGTDSRGQSKKAGGQKKHKAYQRKHQHNGIANNCALDAFGEAFDLKAKQACEGRQKTHDA